MPQDLTKPKKPMALVVAPDGRQIDMARMKQRLAQPGIGSPGIGATLPGNTLSVSPDSRVGAMPALPALSGGDLRVAPNGTPSAMPTAGSALMGANVVGIDMPTALWPVNKASVFKMGMQQNAPALRESREAMAGAAAEEGIATGEFTGMQSGALKVTPDARGFQALEGDFGRGDIPVDAYLKIRADEGAQRQANKTGKIQTRLGGMGGTPMGGGKSILTHTRPSYAAVETKVNGKMVGLPQPVAERFAKIQQTFEDASLAAWKQWSRTVEVGGMVGMEVMAQEGIRAKATQGARQALSPEDKAFLAAVESGAGPKAFGLKELKSKRGRRTNTGGKLGRMYTTADPHPLSDAAGKPKAAPAGPTLTGGMRRNFQLTDKSLSSTSKMATVEKHLRDFNTLTPDQQRVVAGESPNLGAYLAWTDRGLSHEEAMYEAYKVKPAKGDKPIGTEGTAMLVADRYVYGTPKMQKRKVPGPEGEIWVTEPIPGEWLTKPWHEGADKAPASRRKAMLVAYGRVHDDLSNRGWTDKDIVRFFNAVINSPTKDEEGLRPEDKALWLEIKEKLGKPASVGDNTAEAIEARKAAKDQAKVATGPEGENIPGRAQAGAHASASNLEVILDGSAAPSADNAQAMADAISAARHRLTPEQKVQLVPVMNKLRNEFGARFSR